MLTKGASTTIQRTSLVRLFDIHQPFNLNVDHSLSALQFEKKKPKPVARRQLSARLRKRIVGREAGTFLTQRERSAWRHLSQRTVWFLKFRLLYSSSHAWRNQLGEQRGAASDAFWQEVCDETKLGSKLEKLRKNSSLCHDQSRKR